MRYLRSHLRHMLALTLLVFALLIVSAGSASAQTGACPGTTAVTVNPNGWVCITPNTDYNATYTPGTSIPSLPVVVRMNLLLFGPSVTDTATGEPTTTVDIDKPPMNPQGAVWVQVPQLTAIPAGQLFKARVIAIGWPGADGQPQVSARSPESNPFIRPIPAPAPRAPLGISVRPS